MKKPDNYKDVKYYGYGIEVRDVCTHSEREDKQYGDWYESYTNTLSSFAIKDVEYPDVVSILDIPTNTQAFVVWVEYSSGDSFGRGDRNNTTIVGIFKDVDSAFFLKSALEEDYNRPARNWEDRGYKIETADGQLFESVYTPWKGYFESLDSVNVDAVIVTKGGK